MNNPLDVMTPESWGLTVPDGFVYRDINHVPPHVWKWMMEIFKPYGLVILANTHRKWSDGTRSVRGQILVKPEGFVALSEAFAKDAETLFPNKDPSNENTN